MSTLFRILFLLSFFISSCQYQKNQTNPSINGIWESLGSGWVLQIQDSLTYSFYDITAISCLPNRTGNLTEMLEALRLKEDTLSLLQGITTFKFIRTEEVPKLCLATLDEKKAANPEYNFEVFAETVKEHYAFFDLNKINWEALYQEQKRKINENTTEAELYLIIEETLEKLKDNHAFLEATDDVYHALEELEKKATAEGLTNEEEMEAYGDFQIAQMVAKNHLQEEMTKDSKLIQWGKMNNEIGFIQIKAMWLYADLDIPETLIDEVGYVDAYVQTFHKMYEGDYVEKEVASVKKVMNKVMADLSVTKSIVIDVRFNGGGQDAVSYEILSRFVSKDRQVGSQKFRYGKQFSPVQAYLIEGTQDGYSNNVYVLTSPQTGSAAEYFAMATISLPNIKRIGSRTAGATSTTLDKTLPNAWAFSISNEICLDRQGRNYENIGIPVNYELDYPSDRQIFFRSVANDLDKDKRDILKAIEDLEGI